MASAKKTETYNTNMSSPLVIRSCNGYWLKFTPRASASITSINRWIVSVRKKDNWHQIDPYYLTEAFKMLRSPDQFQSIILQSGFVAKFEYGTIKLEIRPYLRDRVETIALRGQTPAELSLSEALACLSNLFKYKNLSYELCYLLAPIKPANAGTFDSILRYRASLNDASHIVSKFKVICFFPLALAIPCLDSTINDDRKKGKQIINNAIRQFQREGYIKEIKNHQLALDEANGLEICDYIDPVAQASLLIMSDVNTEHALGRQVASDAVMALMEEGFIKQANRMSPVTTGPKVNETCHPLAVHSVYQVSNVLVLLILLLVNRSTYEIRPVQELCNQIETLSTQLTDLKHLAAFADLELGCLYCQDRQLNIKAVECFRRIPEHISLYVFSTAYIQKLQTDG